MDSINFLNLTEYNSKLSLSSRITDIFNLYILPAISISGIVIKIMSIKILTKILKKKENYASMFHYMLTNETIDLFNCFIIVFTALFRCGPYCPFGYTYLSKLYELIFYLYTTNMLQQIQTLLEISFSIERLQSFTAKKKSQITFRTKLFIWVVTAVVITAPNYVLSRTVAPIGVLITNNKTEVLYGVVNNFISNNFYGQIFLFILNLVRGFMLFNVLLIVSIIVVIKFRFHLKSKSLVTGNPNKNHEIDPKKKIKKENRVTRMVLSMSLNYIIGSFLASLSPILFQVGLNSTIYNYYGSVANITTYLSHGTYILLYYNFNTTFRRIFLETFCFKRAKTSHSRSQQTKPF